MKVEFDRIRREFLPDGTDTYVEVVVTSGEPTLQAVSAAVDAANEPEQDRYPDDPGASEVIGPWPVPGAANRFTIQVRPPLDIEVLQDWFTRFAELLDAAGLDGRIGLPKQILWPDEVINELPRDQLHAFMAFPLRNPDPFSGARWWNVDPERTQVAANLTPLGADPTTGSFMISTVVRPVRAEDLPEAVAAYVPRDTGLRVWHVRRDPLRAVTYKFSADGSLFRLLHDDAMTWQQQVADHLDVLRTAGSALQFGFIRRLRFRAELWDDLGRQGTPLPYPDVRPAAIRSHVAMFRTQVPDAHGVSILTDAHLDRAHDLSAWNIHPLGQGRHLLTAADLAPWYAHTTVDPDVLAQARRDFGRMIITADDVQAERARWQNR